MNNKSFNSLYIFNHILNLMLFLVLPIVLISSNNHVIQYGGWFLLIIGVIVIFIEATSAVEYVSGIIKYLTEIEYYTIVIEHSKHYLHNKSLDFKTNIDDIRIDDHNALSILTELNDIDIPKYQKCNEYLVKIKSLEPVSEKNHNEQKGQLNHLNEQKELIKTQILSKTQQIKDILDNEKLNRKQQKFSNEYEKLKNQIEKL